MRGDYGLLIALHKALTDEAPRLRPCTQVKVAQDRWRRAQVIVVHHLDAQGEVDQLIVATIEAGQDGIVVIDPALALIIDIEVDTPLTAHGDLAIDSEDLYVGIGYQLAVDCLLRRGGEVECRALMAHNLEETELWAVIFARGEGYLIVLLQEVKCCLHTILSLYSLMGAQVALPQRYAKANEPILVSERSYIGRRREQYRYIL